MAHALKWDSYHDFLVWFESLGDRLPATAQYLQATIASLVGLGHLYCPEHTEMRMMAEPSAADQSLESRVVTKLAGVDTITLGIDERLMAGESTGVRYGAVTAPVGAWDGTLIRQIWAFVQANPELMTFLLRWLKLS